MRVIGLHALNVVIAVPAGVIVLAVLAPVIALALCWPFRKMQSRPWQGTAGMWLGVVGVILSLGVWTAAVAMST